MVSGPWECNNETLTISSGLAHRTSMGAGHLLMGSLAGAARLRKDIEGAQRSAQRKQKLLEECKGKSWLDCGLYNRVRKCESMA